MARIVVLAAEIERLNNLISNLLNNEKLHITQIDNLNNEKTGLIDTVAI